MVLLFLLLWIVEITAYSLEISNGDPKATTTIDFHIDGPNLEKNYVDLEKKILEVFWEHEKKEMIETANKPNFFQEKEPNLLLTIKRENNFYNETLPADDDDDRTSKWTVVWYIASFSGLIAFFLVVSCSEWCCRRNGRSNNTFGLTSGQPMTTSTVVDTPPPSYDHFAPPSYDSLCYGRNGEKSEYDIYVVPVHALGPLMEENARRESPPPYGMTSMRQENNLTQSNNHHVVVIT